MIDQKELAKKVLADYKKEDEYKNILNKIKKEEFSRSKTGKFIQKVSSLSSKAASVLERTKAEKGINAKFIMKPPQQAITKSQAMMRQLFGRENPTFGTGQNLPVISGVLRSGEGLMTHDDMFERKTRKFFGLR